MNLNQADFDYVRAMVREHAAIVLDSDKQYLVEARLLSLAAREGIASLGALIGRLRAGGGSDLERKIIEAMTTNETMFFRDGHPFDALRRHILPDLVARRQSARALNIWCGASSSGQEPYSILMVLREHFPQLASWRVFFLATDLSSEILARAREGRYNQIEVKRGLPAPLLAKYFEPSGSLFQIRRELRQAIEFQPEQGMAAFSGDGHRLPAERAHLLRRGDEEVHPGAGAAPHAPGRLPAGRHGGDDGEPGRLVRAGDL
jgi:chemotaxis protein methyltransferase CheR